MRIRSVYGVYKVIFGYPEAPQKQKVAYGRAIADSLDVIEDVFVTTSFTPIYNYPNQRYPRQLAVDFLDNFRNLINQRPNRPLVRWTFQNATISLPGSLFPNSRKRRLDINFPFMYNGQSSEIIIPTFGPPRNMTNELGVLMRLIALGTVVPALPAQIALITYWDLSSGTQTSLPTATLPLASSAAVLAACSLILN